MKQPRLNDLQLDAKGTEQLRQLAAHSKKIKITFNIDENSLKSLQNMSSKTGIPYQRLLNQILKEGLDKRNTSENRLDRLERELKKLKNQAAKWTSSPSSPHAT